MIDVNAIFTPTNIHYMFMVFACFQFGLLWLKIGRVQKLLDWTVQDLQNLEDFKDQATAHMAGLLTMSVEPEQTPGAP